VVDTGVEAGIRQTRSIAGTKTLINDDVVACASARTASAARRGRSNCTLATNPSFTGCWTTTTRCRTSRWCRRRARTSSLQDAALGRTRSARLGQGHRQCFDMVMPRHCCRHVAQRGQAATGDRRRGRPRSHAGKRQRIVITRILEMDERSRDTDPKLILIGRVTPFACSRVARRESAGNPLRDSNVRRDPLAN